MATLNFTQFLQPDGRQVSVSTEIPDDLEPKATQITQSGLFFECEVLTTGMVSFTISDREEGVDLACELVTNGPAVPDAIARLIRDFPLRKT